MKKLRVMLHALKVRRIKELKIKNKVGIRDGEMRAKDFVTHYLGSTSIFNLCVSRYTKADGIYSIEIRRAKAFTTQLFLF